MDIAQELYTCQRCGYCCQGETTVSLNQDDLNRLFHVLDINSDEAFRLYLRKTNNVIQMQIADGHCVFYNQGCSVHLGRPWRCGQWPLHPSILLDENNLKTIKASCPGINRALTYKQFCKKLKHLLSLADDSPELSILK